MNKNRRLEAFNKQYAMVSLSPTGKEYLKVLGRDFRSNAIKREVFADSFNLRHMERCTCCPACGEAGRRTRGTKSLCQMCQGRGYQKRRTFLNDSKLLCKGDIASFHYGNPSSDDKLTLFQVVRKEDDYVAINFIGFQFDKSNRYMKIATDKGSEEYVFDKSVSDSCTLCNNCGGDGRKNFRFWIACTDCSGHGVQST